MFNATYFEYDDINSSTYNLMIGDFDGSSNPIYTKAFSPELTLIKSSLGDRFYHGGVKTKSPPSFPFSIISTTAISDVNRRAVLSWLVGRNSFKKLKILQPDLANYYYMCVFTDVEIIYINGKCHGFKLTANLDSEYMHVAGDVVSRTRIYTAPDTLAVHVVTDQRDRYIYPVIEYTATDIYDQLTGYGESEISATTFYSGLNRDENGRYLLVGTHTTTPTEGYFYFSEQDKINRFFSYSKVETDGTGNQYSRINTSLFVNDGTRDHLLCFRGLASGTILTIDCLTMKMSSSNATVGLDNIFGVNTNFRIRPNTGTNITIRGVGTTKFTFPKLIRMGV